MVSVGIWDQVGLLFQNVVFGNVLLFGIFIIGIIFLFLVLSKSSFDTILMFMIFPTFALFTSGIFGDPVSKSSYILLVVFVGYKYFSYIVKMIGHMAG